MKKLSATTAKRRLTIRFILVGTAILLSVPTSTMQKTMADSWDNQINALRTQADQYQAQANALRARGDTLQNKLDAINAQIGALQAQIQVNQTKRDQLQAKINDNQEKLAKAQDALGDILANLYVDDNVSSVELLASSQNISDFVDKQEYRTSVKEQLGSLIKEVKQIKKKLENDKQSVEKILSELARQNDQMGAIQADQQNLVNQTRGEEAAYQQLVSNARNSMAAVRAQQQAYYSSLGGGAGAGVYGSFQYWGLSPGNGSGGCSGGYPFCGPQDSMIDPWNLYNRECVSYVAWALGNRFGKSVQPWHGDGNAYEWPSSAPRWSGAWRVYDPQPGDVVVLPRSGGFAPIGHVMIVESVSGGNIFVSQFNFYGTGQYSTMWIKNSGIILLRFPG